MSIWSGTAPYRAAHKGAPARAQARAGTSAGTLLSGTRPTAYGWRGTTGSHAACAESRWRRPARRSTRPVRRVGTCGPAGTNTSLPSVGRQRFTAKGKPLKQVQLFKYLGRIIAYYGSDVPAARRQLSRARAVWGRPSELIGKEIVPAPVAGMFYQALVAAVLLYWCESWVLLPS